ncbi:MAG: phosphotransferase family protein [Actinobacteria bacterium]|nr:phosphotransferase family protein [Actinomycetota bacterium]MCB9389716.1 phosphotransferase family protein [Acidimicrobiia bacterium]
MTASAWQRNLDGLDLDQAGSEIGEMLGADGSDLTARLIAGGRSNLTYGLTDGTNKWVLRRQPLGHVLPTAHDMAREFRVINALAPTEVPVPHAITLVEDASVIGSPFYLMDFVDGRSLRTLDEVSDWSEADGRACSNELVGVLASIHEVEPETVGLGDFGRPEGYMQRQVGRWAKQWDQNATAPLPQVDDLISRLQNSVPAHSDATIVHGDYRLDNTMIHPTDPGEVVAVVDWEMSTLGDPLADLGLLILYWGDVSGAIAAGAAPATSGPGFLSADEVAEAYSRRSGRDLDNIDFYTTFAHFKLAVILEGIHKRYLQGKTVGEGFAQIGSLVPLLVDSAQQIADSSSLPGLRARS